MELCKRPRHRVSMAAVISDNYGIFAWGWNHAGCDGNGVHAEEHALSRANPRRLHGATITIAGIRHRKNGTGFVFSKPCENRCARLIKKFGLKKIEFITKTREWKTIFL
ncbi:MAG: hypothetical protein AAB522_00805 [Patescibacteria group bacterium]